MAKDYLTDDEDLLFDFGDVPEEKFDLVDIRESTGMHMVDFVVEFDDGYDFVEIKDGENPNAENPREIRNKLRNGNLIHTLAAKYRESRFFFNFQDRNNKPIRYVVLLWLDEVDDAMRSNLINQLKAKIPEDHRSLNRQTFDQCVILNLDKFKQRFGENSVWRISDFEDQ